MSEDCLLTENEAADRAKVSRDTIRRLIRAKRLDVVDLGTGGRRRTVRIPCAALARVRPPSAPIEPAARRRRRRPPTHTPIW